MHGGEVGEIDGGGVNGAKNGELGLRGGQRGLVTVPQGHGGTGLQQTGGDGMADATGSSGDDGGAGLEVDLIHGVAGVVGFKKVSGSYRTKQARLA